MGYMMKKMQIGNILTRMQPFAINENSPIARTAILKPTHNVRYLSIYSVGRMFSSLAEIDAVSGK
jgi:hypothetical protein